MKLLILFLISFVIPAEANELARKCQFAERIIPIEISQFGISPASNFVKVGDRVCFIVKSVGRSGALFRLENYPIGGSVPAGQERIYSFKATKTGRFKINCGGSCAFAVSELIVSTESEYKAMEEEYNKFKGISERRRHFGY